MRRAVSSSHFSPPDATPCMPRRRSCSINLGSLGSGVTVDFIQEVQVKTAGYEAQYGSATGGVVNVVTKSGSNDVRGSGFLYAQPEFGQASFRRTSVTNATQEE